MTAEVWGCFFLLLKSVFIPTDDIPVIQSRNLTTEKQSEWCHTSSVILKYLCCGLICFPPALLSVNVISKQNSNTGYISGEKQRSAAAPASFILFAFDRDMVHSALSVYRSFILVLIRARRTSGGGKSTFTFISLRDFKKKAFGFFINQIFKQKCTNILISYFMVLHFC